MLSPPHGKPQTSDYSVPGFFALSNCFVFMAGPFLSFSVLGRYCRCFSPFRVPKLSLFRIPAKEKVKAFWLSD